MSSFDSVRLLALPSTHTLAELIAENFGMSLGQIDYQTFADGEVKIRPVANVAGSSVFIIQSLCEDHQRSVHDKLSELLFLANTVKDAGGARVTAVVPYLCYARQDRRIARADPVTSQYIARLLETSGIDRIVTMDVHNLSAYQNAFRIQTVHVSAAEVFVDYIQHEIGPAGATVVSPDMGGVKRCEEFRQILMKRAGKHVNLAFVFKRREDGIVSGESFVGDVHGRTAIIFDDMISTGSTIAHAVNVCVKNGTKDIIVAATHGLFVAEASRIISELEVRRVLVTNGATPLHLEASLLAEGRVRVLDISKVFADAIRTLHEGELVQ